GYAQAGLLAAANQWKNFVGFLPLMLSLVLIPTLTKLHSKGQRNEFMRLLKTQLAVQFLFCALLVVPLMVLARPILNSYGPGFIDGIVIFLLTMLTTILAAISNPLSKSMQSAGRAWIDMMFSTVWAVVVIGASVVLIPRFLGLGVALSQFAAAAVLTCWQW